MSAQTSARTPREERWTAKQFTLKSGQHAYEGSALCVDMTTGKLVRATTSDNNFFIGFAIEEVDASAADKTINVRLPEEIGIYWFANAGSGTVVATDVGKLCYLVDDQTVSITEAEPLAGRVWAVDSVKGVAVQPVTRGAKGPQGDPGE